MARVIGVIMAYNKNVLAPDKAPKSWMDLLKPEFKGRKLIIQDAAAGTAFNQMYVLEKLLGLDFMHKWAAQQPIVVATTPQLIDLLVRGEALVGATVDHFRAFEPNAVKAGIVGVYPTEGMPLAAAPIAILKNAPHPNAAKLFVDFTLSREGRHAAGARDLQRLFERTDVRTPEGQLPLDRDQAAVAHRTSPTTKRPRDNFPEHFD